MLLLERHLRLLRSVVQVRPRVRAVVKIAHVQTVVVMRTIVRVAMADNVRVPTSALLHAAMQPVMKQLLHQVAVRKENVRQNNNLIVCSH